MPGDEWDAISLNYTSGTTGNPKGVVYSHRSNVLHSLIFSLAMIDWQMSLEPTNHSTIYAPMVAMGEIQLAFAIAILGAIEVHAL